MPTQEIESLLVRIEADTTRLRRATNRATKDINKFERNTNRSLKKVDRSFKTLGTSVKGLVGVMAGLVAMRIGGRLLEDMANLKILSDITGVTAERIQELRFAAKAAGVETQAFDKSMKRFAATLGELRAGQGALDLILKKALPSLRQQLLATKSTSEAFDVYARAVQRVGREEEKAALVKLGFGAKSLALVRALNKGSTGLADEATQARRLGVVMRDDGAAAAETLTTELGKLSDALDGLGKEIVSEIVDPLTKFTVASQGVVARIAPTFSLFSAFFRRDKDAFEEARRRYLATTGATPSGAGGLADVEAQLDRAARKREAATRGSRDALRFKPPPDAAKQISDFQTQMLTTGVDAMAQLRERYLVESGQTLEAIKLQYDQDLERFGRLLDDKLISEKDFQQAREQLAAIASQQIGEHMEDEAEKALEAFQEVRDLIEGEIMTAFSEAFQTGEVNAKKFFSSMLKGMSQMIFKALVLKPLMEGLTGGLGGSGLGGALSGALGFGGGKAAGGPVSPGKSFLVGEKGPELFSPRVAGNITPNGATGGSSVTYNIDARGAEVGVETRIRAALIESQRNQRSAVQQVSEQRRRFPTSRAA